MMEAAGWLQQELARYDFGTILGPADAATWNMSNEDWDKDSQKLLSRLAPVHFVKYTNRRFWEGTRKTSDRWHALECDETNERLGAMLAVHAQILVMAGVIRSMDDFLNFSIDARGQPVPNDPQFKRHWYNQDGNSIGDVDETLITSEQMTDKFREIFGGPLREWTRSAVPAEENPITVRPAARPEAGVTRVSVESESDVEIVDIKKSMATTSTAKAKTTALGNQGRKEDWSGYTPRATAAEENVVDSASASAAAEDMYEKQSPAVKDAEWMPFQEYLGPRVPKEKFRALQDASQDFVLRLRHPGYNNSGRYHLNVRPNDQSISVAEFVAYCKRAFPGGKSGVNCQLFEGCLDVLRCSCKDYERGKFRFEILCRPFGDGDENVETSRYIYHYDKDRATGADTAVERSKSASWIICRIRAVQGHSGPNSSAKDLGRQKVNIGEPGFPHVIAHGTSRHCMDSILQEGLVPGGHFKTRADNHFVDAHAVVQDGKWLPPSKSLAGFRGESEIILLYHTGSLLKMGVGLYWSPSGCILTNEVLPSAALISVRTCESGILVWSVADRAVDLDEHHQRVALGETIAEKKIREKKEYENEAKLRKFREKAFELNKARLGVLERPKRRATDADEPGTAKRARSDEMPRRQQRGESPLASRSCPPRAGDAGVGSKEELSFSTTLGAKAKKMPRETAAASAAEDQPPRAKLVEKKATTAGYDDFCHRCFLACLPNCQVCTNCGAQMRASSNADKAIKEVVGKMIQRAPVHTIWRDRGGNSDHANLRSEYWKYVKRAAKIGKDKEGRPWTLQERWERTTGGARICRPTSGTLSPWITYLQLRSRRRYRMLDEPELNAIKPKAGMQQFPFTERNQRKNAKKRFAKMY